jgi:succinate dehydrogenase hydrophobic anchor subunit
LRENVIREITFISGLLVLILITIHFYVLSSGNFDANISYDKVVLSLRSSLYSTSLILLLIFALVHSWLGVRRALIDSGRSKLATIIILSMVSVFFLVILIIGIFTIITITIW